MKYLFGLLTLLTLVACQNDSKNSNDNDIKLFADYYIRYLQNEQELKAEATFSQGLKIESAKKIDLEGDVFLFNKKLKPVKLNKSIFRYQLEEKMKFKPSYDFKLEQDSGKEINHAIQISSIGKFSLTNGVASRKNGFQLHWDGADLQENERLLVLVTDKNNKAHSISIQGPSKNQTVHINEIDLQPLVAGTGYIYLVKKQENKANQGNVIISSLAEYYSDRILVEIED